MSDWPVGVRRAETADARSLAEVQARSQHTVLPSWTLVSDWQGLLPEEHCYAYLVEADDIFGVIRVGPVTEPDLVEGDTGEVLTWHLLPAWRGNGYGRRLLVHGLTVIKRLHFEQALIWVPIGCERALEVLSRLGFESTGATRTSNVKGAAPEETAWSVNLEAYF